MVAQFPNVLVVHPSLGVKSVEQLVAYGKANSGKLNYASTGIGTSSHLSGYMWPMWSGPLAYGSAVVTKSLRGMYECARASAIIANCIKMTRWFSPSKQRFPWQSPTRTSSRRSPS